MSEPVVKDSDEYKKLKRKLAWLEWVQDRRGLEPYEEEWLVSVTAQIEIADLAHQLGLARVTPSALVSAAQAACDDQAREDAISSLQRACDDSDYYAVRQAGHLGTGVVG